MATRDLYNNVSPAHTVAPQSLATGGSVTGGTVDLAGYESCTFVMYIGAHTAPDTITPTFQDSADGSTWDSIDSEFLQGASVDGGTDAVTTGETDGTLNTVTKLGYIGEQRYVRCNIATSITTGNTSLISVVVLRGVPIHAPA